ncbi:hypothetical protein [Streptomyces sp. H39-S7]|uniref:hypothetical protein n=1 Tax=Streptomyces sp. H39-S7 TaxID=3004357 RepID=UPI0022AE6AFB|nr:hypothetical protein [Streptomyces sp. H39-S7]MCZ4122708.1 hypothetical protein [Streptomyces sp. H39-S7]
MIAVAMPSEVADALVGEKLAIRPGIRGSAAEITLIGITVAATTVSILQGPDTFLRLTEIIQHAFGKRTGITVQITAKGEKVYIEIPVDSGGDVATVARRIQDALTEEDE